MPPEPPLAAAQPHPAAPALDLPVRRLPLQALALGAHLVAFVVAADRSGRLEVAAFLAVLAVVHGAVAADGVRRRAGGVAVASGAAAVAVLVAAAGISGWHVLGPLAGGVALAAIVAVVVAVALATGRDGDALGAAAVAALACAATLVMPWQDRPRLVAAVAPWLLAVAQPLVAGPRARGQRLTWAGAVLASAVFFPIARVGLRHVHLSAFVGALPVVQAVLLLPHVAVLARARDRAAPPRGTLALVAGAALAFVTVAIPLQLEKQWITIGWALEAAALAGLWRRVPHRGLLAACAGLLAAVVIRLAANPALLRYHPRSGTPIWNWYLYAYLVAAGAAFAAAVLLSRGDDRPFPGWPRLSALAGAAGAVLLFALLNVEIADAFSTGPYLVFRFGASLGQDLTYTIGWALFAIALLAAGVALHSRATRGAALALLSITVVKAFLHDLSRLEGLYRVASFVGLAASLAVVAVVLQRFVLRPAGDSAPPEAP